MLCFSCFCYSVAALNGDDADAKPPSSPAKSVTDYHHTSPNGKANGYGSTSSRKRAREDDGETDNEDRSRTQSETRAVKPRTENYKPPQGLWSRLTNTFRSFIGGFRQEMANEADEMNTDGDAKSD